MLKEKHPEGAFHEIGCLAAFIMPRPPVVRYLSAQPPEIAHQFLE
jgi:hypothetical protein